MRFRILWPYGWKDPPNIIYIICDIYIYLYLYIYISIYRLDMSMIVYVMFECLARCTCKFTQPRTCITSFLKLRNKQMNEWKKERKRKKNKERKNEYTRTHYVYIYMWRYIGYMLAVRNLMLQVPVSDYRAMRQAADPLDPKYEVRHAAAKLVAVATSETSKPRNL